jgi:hypothetical protein
MNKAELAQYQRIKLDEALRLRARGELRRPIRSRADADKRLAELRAEGTADRYQRLAQLRAEVAPYPSPSVGLRRDPQGRLRYVDWSVGQVVVRTGRLGRQSWP